MFHISSLFFCLILCISLVQARFQFKQARSKRDIWQIGAYSTYLPLDHFGSNKETFANRYWVNDEFWKPGGPVFLIDAGESNAENYVSWLTFGPVNESSNAMPNRAQRFGALFILWEHRYYGQSLPVQNINGSANLDNVANYYQYLTFEQALEDVAVFAKSFSLATHPDNDFRPNKLPWVFIGGSYPGVRAAWMRPRNPEVIYASLSSSAPVQIQEDFWQYWVAVERKLASTPGYESCLIDMHAMAQWATTIVDQKDVSTVEAFLANATLPSNYNGTSDDTTAAWTARKSAIEYVFSISSGKFQNGGLYGGLGKFCDNLKSSNYTKDTSATTAVLKNGIVAYYGIDHSVEIYAAVIYDLILAKQGSSENPDTWVELSIKYVDGNLPNGFKVDDNLSWTYETCTEAGFFQISNPSRPTNIIPGFIDLDYWIYQKYVSQFGNSVTSGPNTTSTNAKYAGWHLRTSNVFSTNGEYDPWLALSVASDIDPSSPDNILATAIPAPNTVPPNGTVFGYVIKNGLHTSDLNFNLTAVQMNNTDPRGSDKEAGKAHEIFASALSSWLPAYTPFSAAGSLSSGRNGATTTATATATVMASPRQSSVTASGAGMQQISGSVSAFIALALAVMVLC